MHGTHSAALTTGIFKFKRGPVTDYYFYVMFPLVLPSSAEISLEGRDNIMKKGTMAICTSRTSCLHVTPLEKASLLSLVIENVCNL